METVRMMKGGANGKVTLVDQPNEERKQ